MPQQCTYLKKNNQPCRAWAIHGTVPPRCTAHRLDGGPPPCLFQKGNQYGRLRAIHGFYSRSFSSSTNIVDEAADLLLKHERLSACIAGQPDPAGLNLLYRLYSYNLGHLLALLQDYHDTTGHHPDTLLQLANGEPKARRRAELEKLRRHLEIDAAPTYPTTSIRSPRYWLIYNYLVNYIRQYGLSPSLLQIKRACRLTSNHVLEFWLDKLEQDGRIIRRPGQPRSIQLPHHPTPPIQPELPLR